MATDIIYKPLIDNNVLRLGDNSRDIYIGTNSIKEAAHLVKQARINSLMGRPIDDRLKPYIDKLFNWCKVGGDPEFFLTKDNKLVPSFEWLGVPPSDQTPFGFYNTGKWELFPVKPHSIYSSFLEPQKPWNGFSHIDQSTNAWLHADGYQIELGYLPSNCMDVTASNIRGLMLNLFNKIESSKIELSTKTSIEIDDNTPTVELGCRPSFNAHYLNNTINNTNPNKRFTGGHFHFTLFDHPPIRYERDYYNRSKIHSTSIEQVKEFNKLASLSILSDEDRESIFNPIIKAMDSTIGLLSVAMAGELDSPERRDHKYGMAGDYRITHNTLEYRVPSNVMWMHPVLWHIIGMIGREIVNCFVQSIVNCKSSSNVVDSYSILRANLNSIKDYSEIISIINNTDYPAARAYLTKNNYLLHILNVSTNISLKGTNQFKIQKIMNKGLKDTLGLDIDENWTCAKTMAKGQPAYFNLTGIVL